MKLKTLELISDIIKVIMYVSIVLLFGTLIYGVCDNSAKIENMNKDIKEIKVNTEIMRYD